MFAIIITILVVGILFTAGGVTLYARYERLIREHNQHEDKIKRRMYELAILKEIGDRTGYSLDVREIVDIITGSLHQFLDYAVVGYMLVEPEHLIFNAHVEDAISRSFVNDLQQRMHNSLGTLLGRSFAESRIEEVLSGSILNEDNVAPIESYFLIPVVISGVVQGVITVAHTKPGLYKEEDMTILYKITQQASTTVSKLQSVVATEQGKLSAMVESMADGVVMIDSDYRVLVANPAARMLIGVGEADEVTIFNFVDACAAMFDIRTAIDASVRYGETRLSDRIRLGEAFFQISTLPVTALDEGFGDEPEVLGAIVIFHNVTKDVQLQRVRNDFRSMLVHELRTPLTGVKSIIEVLNNPKIKHTKKSNTEYLALITQSVGHMLTLVNDILDVAKLESGKFVVHPIAVAVHDLIDNRLAFFKASAADQKIKLVTEYGAVVPDMVTLDEPSVKQVLNNLISNALKFSHAKGSITIFAFQHDAHVSLGDEMRQLSITKRFPKLDTIDTHMPSGVIFGVADTGVGMKQQDTSKVFDKFKQLININRDTSQKGSGLGLVITKGIVEAHGGSIQVVSEEGVGSVFFFVIPDMLPVQEEPQVQ